MASAGTVTVDFAAETAKFTTELKKVRSELQAVRKDTSLVSSTLKSAGNLVKGYVGFRTAVSALRAVVQATTEAEAAQAQLENALANAGANVKAASAEFRAYATELQRTTTFGDEAIQQVETLLLSFQGLSGETVKRATESVLDLSTRMGIEAPAAAKLLGKALADPVKGLTQLARAGVVFTEQQKDQVKALVDNGKAMEAQAFILSQLEKNFGGAAAAARNTFGGALSGLHNAFDDLLEGKGGVNAAAGAINHLTEAISSPEFQTAFGQLISGLVKVVELTAKLATGMTTAAARVGEGFAKMAHGALPIEALNLDEVMRQMDEVEQRRNNLATMIPNWESNSAASGQIKELDQQIAKLKERQTLLEGLPKRPLAADFAAGGALDFTTGGNPTGTTEISDEEKKRRQKLAMEDAEGVFAVEQLITDLQEQETQKRLLIEQGYLASKAELDNQLLEQGQQVADRMVEQGVDTAARRLETERQLQQDMQALRESAVNAGIGLMQLLAQKSKTAAKALILINRGLAIAQAVQNTSVAVTKALAIYGPTPQGYAAAASAKVMGAIQIGLIAATGALEVSAVNTGRGGSVVGPGSPNNPVFTDDINNSQERGVTPQTVVQVSIQGVVSQQVLDELWDGLADLANGRDKIMFGRNSRQAKELQGG